MKKTILALLALTALALATSTPAKAGKYYDLRVGASSSTLRVGGEIQVADPSSPYATVIRLKGSTGNVTATSFTGNLTGNVTGNTSGTAGSLAANGTNCSAGNYPLGVDASGNAEGCTSAGVGDVVAANNNTLTGSNTFTQHIVGGAYPYLGTNYLISSSSGVAAYITGNNTFKTPPLTYMYGGTVYTTSEQSWTVVDSSSTIITADATGLHQWGLLSFTAASISSYTASAFTDSLIVAVSTAGSGHDAHLFYPTNTYPGQSVAFTNAGRGSNINSMTVTSGAQPPVWWNCGASKNVFSTCVTGAPEIKPMSAERGELGGYSSGGESGQAEAFIVNNASGGTATIAFTNYSAGTCVVSVKGAGLTQIPASTNSTSISLGTGYQSLIIACSGEGITSWNLPANVVFVRPGYI